MIMPTSQGYVLQGAGVRGKREQEGTEKQRSVRDGLVS